MREADPLGDGVDEKPVSLQRVRPDLVHEWHESKELVDLARTQEPVVSVPNLLPFAIRQTGTIATARSCLYPSHRIASTAAGGEPTWPGATARSRRLHPTNRAFHFSWNSAILAGV